MIFDSIYCVQDIYLTGTFCNVCNFNVKISKLSMKEDITNLKSNYKKLAKLQNEIKKCTDL